MKARHLTDSSEPVFSRFFVSELAASDSSEPVFSRFFDFFPLFSLLSLRASSLRLFSFPFYGIDFGDFSTFFCSHT